MDLPIEETTEPVIFEDASVCLKAVIWLVSFELVAFETDFIEFVGH